MESTWLGFTDFKQSNLRLCTVILLVAVGPESPDEQMKIKTTLTPQKHRQNFEAVKRKSYRRMVIQASRTREMFDTRRYDV